MSDDTSTVRILDADPERVVSVTVGELQELLRAKNHTAYQFHTQTVHERTCHFVYRDESYSTPDGCEQDGTYYCSACDCDLPDWMQWHVDDIQAGKIENDIDRCPICGARLEDDGKEEGGSDDD